MAAFLLYVENIETEEVCGTMKQNANSLSVRQGVPGTRTWTGGPGNVWSLVHLLTVTALNSHRQSATTVLLLMLLLLLLLLMMMMKVSAERR